MNRDITIQADCLMPARLIERALEQGAQFDTIHLRGKKRLTLQCDAASARILLSLCERFSIPVKVLRRGGGSGLVAFACRRRTLSVGLALLIALSALFLSRIWRVDVAFSGDMSPSGDRAALLSVLEVEGITPGIARRNVDPGLLARKLTASGAYSYVGARLHGIRLLIEAVPEVPAPAVYDVNAARDLVSGRNGVVVRAVVRSGQLCVKPGDVVRRGQLLIRGEEMASGEDTRPIAALGEVVLRSWVTGQAVLPLSGTISRPTGRVSVSTGLSTPWHVWLIADGESFPQQSEEVTRVPIGGMFVPVERVRVVRRETEELPAEADRDALTARLAALALSDAAMQLGLQGPESCEITDSWVNYEQADGALRALAVYEIQADAAVARQGLQGG